MISHGIYYMKIIVKMDTIGSMVTFFGTLVAVLGPRAAKIC